MVRGCGYEEYTVFSQMIVGSDITPYNGLCSYVSMSWVIDEMSSARDSLLSPVDTK